MQSRARSVPEYLAELPEDRRPAIAAVRDLILENLPEGYEETMLWGMIVCRVPESVYLLPGKKPLSYVALASQKGYMSLYLHPDSTSRDGDDWFVDAYRATGKRLDMGKSCVRFRKLDDLPLEAVGRAVAMISSEELIQRALSESD